jgi:hypothetical protein
MQDDLGVEPGSAFRALSIWGAAIVYVVLLPLVGYLVATPIFIALVLWLFSVRRPWLLVGVSLGFTVSVSLIFVLFLHVRLPTGLLDGVLRHIGFV